MACSSPLPFKTRCWNQNQGELQGNLFDDKSLTNLLVTSEENRWGAKYRSGPNQFMELISQRFLKILHLLRTLSIHAMYWTKLGNCIDWFDRPH